MCGQITFEGDDVSNAGLVGAREVLEKCGIDRKVNLVCNGGMSSKVCAASQVTVNLQITSITL